MKPVTSLSIMCPFTKLETDGPSLQMLKYSIENYNHRVFVAPKMRWRDGWWSHQHSTLAIFGADTESKAVHKLNLHRRESEVKVSSEFTRSPLFSQHLLGK